MLPGLAPKVSGLMKLSELSLVNTAVGASSVVVPATARAGDLAIIANTVGSDGPASQTPPPGWSVLYSTGALNTSYDHQYYWKLLNSSDVGVTVNVRVEEYYNRTALIVLRPNAKIKSVTPFSMSTQHAEGAISAVNISTAGYAAPVVLLTSALSTSSPPTISGTIGGSRLTYSNTVFAYEIQNGTPADRTSGQSDGGQNHISRLGVAVE